MQLTVDMMLKMKPEEFIETVKNLPYGSRLNLRNLIKMQYGQCQNAKDSLNALLEEEQPKDDREQTLKTIEDMYVIMQLLEDRHNILDIIIEEGKLG